MAWFGFWIFLCVFVVTDAWLYSKGHDGFLFTHTTPTEIALRDKAAGGYQPINTGEGKQSEPPKKP